MLGRETVEVVSEELTPREVTLRALDEDETKALDLFSASKASEISKTFGDAMYELFLRGMPCREIVKRNPGVSLGQVVHVRVRDLWDDRLRYHDERLFEQARTGAARITLEAVEYVSKLLAANHKLSLQKVERFLQTGNPEDLGASETLTFKQYREMLDALMKLTGQDATRIKGEILHRHVGEEELSTRTVEPTKPGRILEIAAEKREARRKR